jgi:hypothetical protein
LIELPMIDGERDLRDDGTPVSHRRVAARRGADPTQLVGVARWIIQNAPLRSVE